MKTSKQNTDKVSYYIIKDLSTWADGSPEKSKLERFDSLQEAMIKFSEYQGKDVEDKPDMARTTLGVSVNGIECDVIHVINNANCLSLDFTHSKSVEESSQFLDDLQILYHEIGFDKVRVHREMSQEEVKVFVKQRFEYQIKNSGIDDISFYMDRFDALYEQGKMERLMPTANQKHIVEDIPFSEWENPYINAESREADRPETELGENLVVLQEKNTKKVLEEKQTIVTLTVAECGEFHSFGEYHDDIASVEDAIAVFNQMPSGRMNGIKSIGINIHKEGTESYEDIQIDIVSGKSIDLEMLEYYPEIIKNPKALMVISELIEKFPKAEVFGSLDKWLTVDMDEAFLLAKEIDQLSYDYATYQYKNTVEDRDAQIMDIAEHIRNGHTEYLNDFLNALISENFRIGIMNIFGEGLEIDDSEGVQVARKAQKLLDKLAEYKPLAKIGENAMNGIRKGNYNMIDNVLNNEKLKEEQEQKSGRISIKKKLAEKKVVIEQVGMGEKEVQEKETGKNRRGDISI